MELSEKIEFKKIRDFGGILNATFEFIRQNFKKLLLSLLLIVGPAVLLMGIVNGYNQSNMFELKGVSPGGIVWKMIGINYLIMFIVTQLLICVTYSFIDLYLERNLNDFEISDVWDKVKEYIGLTFSSSIGAGLIIIIGTVLLVIPGIYMSIVLSIIFMVRIREKLSFTDSISRCRSLITDNWWATFGILIVLYLIEYFFSLVLSIPQIIVVIIQSFHKISNPNTIVGPSNILIVITSVIAAFSFLFYSIVLIGISFQYFNLVEKKDAAGLFEKLDSINQHN